MIRNNYLNEELFNQILSTFKFTDSSSQSSADTSTWKTYTDTALGFSFKYPEKLTLKENNTNIVLDNYKEIDYNPKESPFRGNEVENISITIIIFPFYLKKIF